MGPPSKIVFANTRIADVVAKLEAMGCRFKGCDYREAGMPAKDLMMLTLNGIRPFSIAFVVERTGQNEAWFVYMRSNGSATLWEWLWMPFEPVLDVIALFLPQKEYVPTEEERQLRHAQDQIVESLQADAAFVATGCYDSNELKEP